MHSDRIGEGVHVIRLNSDAWQHYKALRLEALRLEPEAFSTTYEEARIRPDAWWPKRLSNSGCATLMARAGQEPIGMITACRGDGDDTGIGFIFGMYVNAQHRRQGVGRALLQAGITHLAAIPEITTIRLWVKVTHHPARQLYESLGFRAVDDASSQTPDGELQMERPARL